MSPTLALMSQDTVMVPSKVFWVWLWILKFFFLWEILALRFYWKDNLFHDIHYFYNISWYFGFLISVIYESLLWNAEEGVTVQSNASNIGNWLSLSRTLSLSVCLRFIVLAACIVFLCELDDFQHAFKLKDVMPMETVSTPTPNLLLHWIAIVENYCH